MKTPDVYDYVIVGAGLSGLLVTKALQGLSEKILLLDGADGVGGINHAQETGLRFLPHSEASLSAVHFLNSLLANPLPLQLREVTPQTFESGSLRPFVGFGENPPAFYEELQYFLASQQALVGSGPEEWCKALAAEIDLEKVFKPRSLVTKFIVENELITGVLVNGQKTILAHNVIYCGPVRDLFVLLPEEALSTRARLKLNKGKYWTALGLDIVHNGKISENYFTHLLNGTTDDELGPSVGQFKCFDESTNTQVSQWVTFIDNEDAEESENIGLALKKIKRQIKRAYPTAVEKENIKLERILVAPGVGGNGELKLSANQSLPNLPNLFIAHGVMNSQKNLLGTLAQAQLIAAALGYKAEEKYSTDNIVEATL
jgi:hypothetical protein